jgi:hypothetical protein
MNAPKRLQFGGFPHRGRADWRQASLALALPQGLIAGSAAKQGFGKGVLAKSAGFLIKRTIICGKDSRHP